MTIKVGTFKNSKYKKQHITVDRDLFDTELNLSEILALSMINDRMKSSAKRDQFYDAVEKDHYVVFTRKEMGDLLNIKSPTTITTIYNHLEELGYITRKKANGFNATSLIFLTYFKSRVPLQCTKFVYSKKQYLNPNHLIFSHSYFNLKEFKQVNTMATPLTSPKKESAINRWKTAVTARYGFAGNVAEAIAMFTNNNVTEARSIVKTISTARTVIAKENNLVNTPESHFESNDNVKLHLADKLKYIFSYIKDHGFKSYGGYLMNCLKAFFADAMGIEADTKSVAPQAPGNTRVKETLPDWAKTEIKPQDSAKVSKISEADKIRLQERVAALV